MRKKTHEEFIKQIKDINPNIEIIGRYDGTGVKIDCRCKIDGCMWSSTPDNLLRGKGCPKCAGVKKKTHEEFVAELKEISPDIGVVGKYKGNKKKVKCQCLTCGDEWEPTPSALLRGTRCPKCFGNKKKTHKEFVNQMKNTNPNIEIIGKYVGALAKIKCKCMLCGNIWDTRPSVLLSNYGCPHCARTKERSYSPRKTHEEFVKLIREINPNIEIIEKYNGVDKKIKCRCLFCNNEWDVAPKNLYGGKGCPNCASSKGEKN